MDDRTVYVICGIVITFTVIFSIFSIAIIIVGRDMAYRGEKQFEQDYLSNITIVDGIIDSPAIKIKIKTATEFMLKINDNDILDIVYRTSRGDPLFHTYYVFSKDYQIGYFFDPTFESTTGEMVNK